MQPARQSTAKTVIVGPVLDASGVAVTDGVVGDLKISKNGAAPAALNGSATLTHRHTGFYSLTLTASDLDTVGSAQISIDDTVNTMPLYDLTVIEEAVYDGFYANGAVGGPANIIAIDGQLTNGNNATLNLRQLNVQNDAGVALVVASSADDAARITTTVGNYGLFVQGGSIALNCQGTTAGIQAHGTAGDGFAAVGQGSGGHGIAATASNTTGSGISAAGGSASGSGMRLAGGGTGSGLRSTGGATGHGAILAGGATSGSGLRGEATGGGNGAVFIGVGGNAGFRADGGATGAGAQFNGGSTGAGIAATGGSTNQNGITATGGGSGSGLRAVGGTTGNGLAAAAGASGGDGINVSAASLNGRGMYVEATGSGAGIWVAGGTFGMHIEAQTAVDLAASAAGIDITASSTGIVMETGGTNPSVWIRNTSSGPAMHLEATSNNDGLKLTGQGTGHDVRFATERAPTLAAILFNNDSAETYSTAVAGSVVKEIVDNTPGGTGASITDIVDAVWDEQRSGHVDPGSFGQIGLLIADYSTGALVANITGSLSGSVGSVNDLDNFFTLNTGLQYVDSVQGSVVREITENAASGGIDLTAIEEALAAIEAILATIRPGRIVMVSPVARNGNITIVQGDSYTAAMGRALEWTDEQGVWPDLTEAVVELHIDDGTVEVVGSCTNPGAANQTVRVEPRGADTSLLGEGTYPFRVVAEFTGTGSTDRATLVAANCKVLDYEGS